jgi:hypothetical protein
MDTLQSAKHMMANNLSGALPYLSSAILKDAEIYLHGIDNGMHFVRLLKDPSERQDVRTIKKIQTIRLKPSRPTNLCSCKMFVRFNDTFEQEKKIATEKAEKFRKLGCSSMQLAIMKTLDSCKATLEEAHCGFHRMSIADAALVLTKLYSCQTGPDVILFSDGIIPDDVKPKKYGYPVCFAARVYPLITLKKLITPRIQKIVDYLEVLPEKNNKPIFDHFLAIVPGVQFVGVSRNDNYRSIDMELIGRGCLTPILMGERDGKCYFLSYWG